MRVRIAKKVAKRGEKGIGNYSPGKVARAKAMVERGKKRLAKNEEKKQQQLQEDEKKRKAKKG
jgi:hypothetical protein